MLGTMKQKAKNPPIAPPVQPQLATKRSRGKWWLLAILLIALYFLIGGWPIVAIVNYRPIFRWQLNRLLFTRFGSQTLEQIISEQLISAEAAKQKISITQSEIDSKSQEIVQSLGENVSLDDMLKFQGMSKQDFESQLRLQLLVTKLLSRDLSLTDQDIDDYLVKNRELLSATEPGKLREQAKQALIDQKVSEKLQPWFLEIKEKAKIWRLP